MATGQISIIAPRPTTTTVSLPKKRTYVSRVYSKNTLLGLGMLMTLGWIGVALLAPWIMPYDPLQGDAALAQGGLSFVHPFGLDKYGRDIFSRVIYGSRYDLLLSFTVVMFSMVLGTFLGSISGFLGGKIEWDPLESTCRHASLSIL